MHAYIWHRSIRPVDRSFRLFRIVSWNYVSLFNSFSMWRKPLLIWYCSLASEKIIGKKLEIEPFVHAIKKKEIANDSLLIFIQLVSKEQFFLITRQTHTHTRHYTCNTIFTPSRMRPLAHALSDGNQRHILISLKFCWKPTCICVIFVSTRIWTIVGRVTHPRLYHHTTGASPEEQVIYSWEW